MSQTTVMTLDEMFAAAEHNNPALVVSASAIAEAQAGLGVAKGAMMPDVDVNVSLSVLGNAWVGDRNFSDGKNVETPHFGNTYSVAMTQMLYAGGAIRRAVEMARLNQDMAELGHCVTRQSIRLMIAGYYLDLCKLLNQKTILLKNIDQTQRLVEEIEANYAAGTALKSDITRYELQLQGLNLSYDRVANALDVTTRYLNTALGLPADAATVPDTAVSGHGRHMMGEGEWQDLVEASPQVRMAGKVAEVALCANEVCRAGMRPTVALRIEDKLEGPITYEVPTLDKNVNFWYAGVSVSYNLGSLYKQRRKVAASRLAVATAQARLDERRSQSRADVHAAFVNFQEALTDLRTHQKSVQLAHENYDVIHYRYLNGMALLTDMLDASNQQLNSELLLVNSGINVVYRQLALKAATGTL